MKTNLPEYIVKSIMSNSTSLGDHPSFPPDDEEKFLLNTVSRYFDTICEKNDITDIRSLRKNLGNILTDCQKLESKNKEALEKLAVDVTNDILSIPEGTVTVDARIVDNIDKGKQRVLPEKTDGFEFDSIEEMNRLSDEIYKRRMLNALVSGASLTYAMDMERYISILFKISPDLPSLYDKLLNYNNILIYFEKDTIGDGTTRDSSNVDVYINPGNNDIQIAAKGIVFPLLLNEILKGFNELAISHGLPKKKEMAKYVIKKSDFKLAELWDLRLGLPLWDIIANSFKRIEYDIDEIGLNFFLMELSTLRPYDFNETLKELFAKTKKGDTILKRIIDNIIEKKEQDDFDKYMSARKKNKYQLTDSLYFSANELITNQA